MLLRPAARQNMIWAIVAWYGPVARYLGLLATVLSRFDDAARHFEYALRMCERMEALPYLTRTRVDYARMLLKRASPGDREAAVMQLDVALEKAQRLGMPKLVEQGEALAL